jgi:Alternative complex III, ActD subunit
MKEISGYYDKEASLLEAVKNLRESKIKIKDVFSPYPVHGLDHAMGLRRSWLPKAAFIGGAIGAISGFGFQAWVFTRAYPINIGGKPFLATPSFIPVTFECAILFAAFAIVISYLFRSHLGAGADNKIYDERATDDRFVVVLDTSDSNNDDTENIKSKFENTGALDIKYHD